MAPPTTRSAGGPAAARPAAGSGTPVRPGDDARPDAPRPDAPQPGGTAEPGDAAELADALTRAVKRMRRRTAAGLEPYGITPGQGRALRVLAHASDCETPGRAMRLSELADVLHIAPRSATTVVDALEASGLVVRAPDPADRRAVGLHLTEAGRRAVERIGLVRQEVAEEYFADVSAGDREALLRVLRRTEASYGVRTAHPQREQGPGPDRDLERDGGPGRCPGQGRGLSGGAA